jgi:hypothetical protein
MISRAFAAEAEKVAAQARDPLSIIVDVAAILSVIVWPIIILIALYLFREIIADLLRERIPAILRELAGKVTKLGIGGVTLEFAKAKAFTPGFSSATAGVDLRQRASAMQVTDSTARTFLNQLRDPTTADYAIVNLGTGDQWLTSRLYIMAVVLPRMKGLKAFVFFWTNRAQAAAISAGRSRTSSDGRSRESIRGSNAPMRPPIPMSLQPQTQTP